MSEAFQRFSARRLDDDAASAEPVAPASPQVEDAPVEGQRWQLREIHGPLAEFSHTATASLQEDELEARRAAAEAEGYAAGIKAAEAESHRLLAAQSQQLQNVIAALRAPLKALDERVESELLELTLAVSGLLLRKHMQTEPGLVMSMLRQAIAALPSATARLEILINPADLALLNQHIADSGEALEPNWHISPDDSIRAGGCRIEAGDSHVDDRLELRLERILDIMASQPPVPYGESDRGEL